MMQFKLKAGKTWALNVLQTQVQTAPKHTTKIPDPHASYQPVIDC